MKHDIESAIICQHCAKLGSPILLALRDADSGWQFLCGRAEIEQPELAQVWSLSEVVAKESSLRDIIESGDGAYYRRKGESDAWIRVR